MFLFRGFRLLFLVRRGGCWRQVLSFLVSIRNLIICRFLFLPVFGISLLLGILYLLSFSLSGLVRGLEILIAPCTCTSGSPFSHGDLGVWPVILRFYFLVLCICRERTPLFICSVWRPRAFLWNLSSLPSLSLHLLSTATILSELSGSEDEYRVRDGDSDQVVA